MAVTTTGAKRCRGCSRSLPLEEFARHKGTPSGRGARCRECERERVRLWREKNPRPRKPKRPPLTPEERRERRREQERARREAARLNPGTCELEGCERPTYGRRICSMHEQRIAKHGDPDVNLAYAPDDQVTYDAAHKRVKRARGKASEYICESPECEAQAAHWAYGYGDPEERAGLDKGGKHPSPFSLDPSRYFPLCAPCHGRADREVIKLRRERDLITRAAEAEMKSRQSWADHGYVRAA